MKAVQLLVIGIFIFVSILSSIMGFWIFQGVPECTVGSAPKTIDEFGVYKDQFKAGEILRVERDLESKCKMTFVKVWRTIATQDTMELVASDEFRPTPIAPGTTQKRVAPMKIPDGVHPGKYVYRVFITYQVNPLRDGTFELQPPVKFEGSEMITIADYFGCWIHHRDVTEEVMENASRLLDHVDKLMAYAIEDMVTLPINPDTNSQVSGREYGGFRPFDCPIGAKTSAHKVGLAVDIYDPQNDLDEWITDEMLEECGLYREHPTATIRWCHLTVRRPGSGNRTFHP